MRSCARPGAVPASRLPRGPRESWRTFEDTDASELREPPRRCSGDTGETLKARSTLSGHPERLASEGGPSITLSSRSLSPGTHDSTRWHFAAGAGSLVDSLLEGVVVLLALSGVWTRLVDPERWSNHSCQTSNVQMLDNKLEIKHDQRWKRRHGWCPGYIR